MASMAIWKIEGSIPHRNRAGMVKITPEASEELAEPAVWEMLLSRMVARPKNLRVKRKKPTVITATGIEVETVKPTSRPR